MDRNLYHEPDNIRSAGSLSARRAWIEISRPSGTLRWTTVALRKESVDRNAAMTARCAGLTWSLSARRAWIEIITAAANTWKMWRSLSARRAWIEIASGKCCGLLLAPSLSARRAWIEIFPPYCSPQNKRVALRKESVDRNNLMIHQKNASLSARRAWIEISTQCKL